MIADQATPATATSALTVAGFKASLNPFRLSANRCWPIPRSLGPSVQAPAAELIRATRISNLSAPFPLGQRSDRIALPLGKCRAVACRSFPALPSACQARCGRPRTKLSFSLSAVAPTARFHSPWLINQNPEPPNSPSISLLMPGCGLNRFTSRWDSRRKLKPSRPFSISSRPRTKIDHSIHLLESLT